MLSESICELQVAIVDWAHPKWSAMITTVAKNCVINIKNIENAINVVAEVINAAGMKTPFWR